MLCSEVRCCSHGYHGTVDTDHLHCEVQIYALAEERDWQSATTDKQDRHVVTAP